MTLSSPGIIYAPRFLLCSTESPFLPTKNPIAEAMGFERLIIS
jgi:hypothetical protein